MSASSKAAVTAVFLGVTVCALFAVVAGATASPPHESVSGRVVADSALASSATPAPDSVVATSGQRFEIRKGAEGTVEFVDVSDDVWQEDTQAAGKSPILMYAAAFATFSIVLGAGMTGIAFWEETH